MHPTGMLSCLNRCLVVTCDVVQSREKISNLEHLYIIEVLMQANTQQSCSKATDVHFNLNDAFTV